MTRSATLRPASTRRTQPPDFHSQRMGDYPYVRNRLYRFILVMLNLLIYLPILLAFGYTARLMLF